MAAALPLAGLAVPDEDSRDLEAATSFDAVRLFERHAALARRDGPALAKAMRAHIQNTWPRIRGATQPQADAS